MYRSGAEIQRVEKEVQARLNVWRVGTTNAKEVQNDL